MKLLRGPLQRALQATCGPRATVWAPQPQTNEHTKHALTRISESKEQNIVLTLLNHTCKIQMISKTKK